MSDNYVWIDPARKSGEPCIGGTRIPVSMVAELVWAEDVGAAEDTWDLTRGQVLVACWYAGAYGIVELHDRNGYRTRLPTAWRRRWREWAWQVHPALWEVTRLDYDAIPDPPGRTP